MFKIQLFKLLSLLSVIGGMFSSANLSKAVKPKENPTFSMEYLQQSGTASHISFSANLTTTTMYQIEVYIINEYYPNGKIIGRANLNNKKMVYEYDYMNDFNGLKNSIKIIFGLKTSLTTTSSEIKFSTSKNSSLNSSYYVYNPGPGKLIYQDSKWTQKDYSYLFYQFDSLYIPSYYHYLSFDNFEIYSYAYVDDLRIKDIKLYITNRNGIFDDMDVAGQYAVIPLELTCNQYLYHLKVKNTYYVNPTTLLMSSTAKSGYVKTNHIFFPHNEMKYQGEYVGRIIFSGFNQGGSNLTYQFTFNAQINLLGNCIDSEYCVVTKDAKENELAYEI